MFYKLMRLFIVVVGCFIGPGLVLLGVTLYNYFASADLFSTLQTWVPFVAYIASGIISGIIFFILSKRLAGAFEKNTKKVEAKLAATPSVTLLSGTIGLILGLVVAALISIIIGLIPIAWLSIPLTILVYLVFGSIGLSMGVRRRFDFTAFLHSRKSGKGTEARKEPGTFISPKILDTSVIIDGRILDICKTGMFEGDIVVPEFVLKELQRIADSSDSMKRTRGRRGLDILSSMQKELKNSVRVTDADYEDVPEVDIKLLKLAKDLGGKVVTNDYNLNKVAAVQDVPVFNINELANAVKPILMAGEEMSVTIVKDGKEASQGVAYLDDGTMIVVEGAKGREGETLDVIVTSVLQTAAGRMIFAKTK
ncbi:PIN/TRAM domain-containing protein [Christensenella intestinihominis]|uniref:PIN/TRAM domain-containing protein n=1 Tax=Christensenella intestinihominis TaxID=1851429 RepID=UPI000829BF57|nr:PIN domain-containing protein [Christensenella intestinihominis]